MKADVIDTQKYHLFLFHSSSEAEINNLQMFQQEKPY